LLTSPALLWLILAAPLAYLTLQYAQDIIYYGGYIHHTGRISVWLLFLALLITPLRLTFPRAAWTRWLMQRRRHFGVASFGYALAHVLAYVIRKEEIALMLEEGAGAEYWTGWLAFAMFIALSLTSNNASVRELGRNWRALHRFVHAAALLTLAHWILTAFDPMTAYITLVILIAIEAYRIAMKSRARNRAA